MGGIAGCKRGASVVGFAAGGLAGGNGAGVFISEGAGVTGGSSVTALFNFARNERTALLSRGIVH